MDKHTKEMLIIEEIIERAHKEAFSYRTSLKRMTHEELSKELENLRLDNTH